MLKVPFEFDIKVESNRTNTDVLKPSGYYMYHKIVHIKESYDLSRECIYGFGMDLRINSDYFPIQL